MASHLFARSRSSKATLLPSELAFGLVEIDSLSSKALLEGNRASRGTLLDLKNLHILEEKL